MRHLITISLIFFTFQLFSQDECAGSNIQTDIQGNGVLTRLLNGGDMFWTFDDAYFKPEYNGPTTPSTIFAAAFWMGGVNSNNLPIVAAQDYRTGGANSFWPGPIVNNSVDETTCSNWDKHFSITEQEINAFLSDYNDDGILQEEHTALKRWPATGNPYFMQEYGFSVPTRPGGMADFKDVNQDGIYNIADGDYPAVYLESISDYVVPTVQIYNIFNNIGGFNAVTGSDPIVADIQQTTYAFSCPDNPLFHNTIFMKHKIIYYAPEPLYDFHYGLFVDFDMGCYTDDYVGSAPENNAFFAYNGTATDEADCQFVFTYSENIPVQSVVFLNQDLGNFSTFYNTTSPNVQLGQTDDPVAAPQFYEYLRGSWKDGTPITSGGTGYNPNSTDYAAHIFSGNPNDINEWSMLSSNLPPTDIRGLGSVNHGQLDPGSIIRFNTAFSYHRKPGNDNLSNVNLMYAELPVIQQAYNDGFQNICSLVNTNKVEEQKTLSVAPNPASNYISIGSSFLGSNTEVRILDMTGKVVFSQKNVLDNNSIDIAHLSQGIYIIQVRANEKYFITKLVKK